MGAGHRCRLERDEVFCRMQYAVRQRMELVSATLIQGPRYGYRYGAQSVGDMICGFRILRLPTAAQTEVSWKSLFLRRDSIQFVGSPPNRIIGLGIYLEHEVLAVWSVDFEGVIRSSKQKVLFAIQRDDAGDQMPKCPSRSVEISTSNRSVRVTQQSLSTGGGRLTDSQDI